MIYDIWMEGFHIQGGDPVQATLLGQAEGNSFEEAVKNWYTQHPSSSFNVKSLTEWGCRLYPTEQEARKFMG